MRDFIRPRGRLRTLPFPARLVYSVFAALTLIALGFSAWLGAEMVGADLGELDAYYAGAPAPSADPPAAVPTGSDGGPALDLPPEADAPSASASAAMPLRKLLEVTHFHLFSMPVYLLILSHLFMLSRLPDRPKLFWIALGTLAVAAHIAAPWLARGGTALGRWAYGTSGAALLGSFVVLTAVPLWEMWAPLPAGERSAGSDE